MAKPPAKGHNAKPAVAAPADAKAEDAKPADGSAADAPPEDEFAQIPHLEGPKLVNLGHGAEINLPAGMVLIEQDTAQKLLRDGGANAEGVVALVIKRDSDWEIRIDYDDVGYVSDDDAKDLDSDGLMKSFQEGTAEQNKVRASKGLSELFIDGWSEPLRYDKGTQQLVWGLKVHSTKGPSINFFTRLLGRNGYLSIDLIAAPEKLEAAKVEALVVLNGTHFKPGSTYTDHASGDKDSGMGLTALVVGGTGLLIAKKTGLLIGLLIFLKKGAIFLIAGIGAFFKRLFGGKKKAPQAPLVSTTDQVPPPTYTPPSDLGAQPPQPFNGQPNGYPPSDPPSDPNNHSGNNGNGGGWPHG